MNDDRRKAIAKAIATLEDAQTQCEMIRDEEQEYFDNMPENMQGGDRGSAAEDAISELDEAVNNCESAVSSLQGIS